MSGTAEDDKLEAGKNFPLDLAKLATVKTADGKTPVVMTGQSLRNMRVLAQSAAASCVGQTSIVTPAIITTNLVPQAVIKQSGMMNASPNLGQTNQASITLQRPAQITIASTSLPVVQATSLALGGPNTYHVPRGPAVVANLAAPRSNVATAIRSPMVVAAQNNTPQSFVRPSRTPSPAQGTAWLTTNSSNGTQIKGAPTVLSSPVRGASVTTSAMGKPQLLARTQATAQTVSAIRPATATILHTAITIGQQGAQIHPFKAGQPTSGIQALGNTVTLAQMLPSRTQTLVYSSTGANATHFSSNPRFTVASTVPSQRQTTTSKSLGQVTTARLAMPIPVTQAGTTRLVATPGTVLTTGARLSAATAAATHQSTMLNAGAARILPTTQPTVTLGRLAVTVAGGPAPASSTSAAGGGGVLGQARISALSLNPLVAVVNTTQTRTLQPQQQQQQCAKVLTQPVQGTSGLLGLSSGDPAIVTSVLGTQGDVSGNTIHIPQMPASIKSNVITTTARTINMQPAMIAQRPITTVAPQTVSIAKVFAQHGENHSPTANVFIHAPMAPRKTSPGPKPIGQAGAATPVTSYSLQSGTYFYNTRPFNQQSSFAAVPQSNNTHPRTNLTSQMQGLVTNQHMQFNSVMVVEQGRSQIAAHALPQDNHHELTLQQQQQQQQQQGKITSSPRPSILRKRDHDGSPLKAAKNLNAALAAVPLTQQHAPLSPPSRPDSGGNGNSSGGSTTISATSSPGVAEPDDSIPMAIALKEEEESVRPPMEMSPRKKPRKQQLTGNDIDENRQEDMQFFSEGAMKREPESENGHHDHHSNHSHHHHQHHHHHRKASPLTVARKPPTATLLNSYRQTWKATHNHYLRYSDVRPKDERRPSIMDLANQCRVLDKVNGWKIHHLSTQMEDLAEQEQNVYDQLSELLKRTEPEECNDKDLNRVNELIKGNLQRIKIINDGMIDAKAQIMKIFDHKIHVTDIISRCASKRNFKKRDKS